MADKTLGEVFIDVFLKGSDIRKRKKKVLNFRFI